MYERPLHPRPSALRIQDDRRPITPSRARNRIMSPLVCQMSHQSQSTTAMLCAVGIMLLALLGGTGCCRKGELITTRIMVDMELSRNRFFQVFQDQNLDRKTHWYLGNDERYSYFEIHVSRPIDEHDDMFNRRVHHEIYRYRVVLTSGDLDATHPFFGFDSSRKVQKRISSVTPTIGFVR